MQTATLTARKTEGTKIEIPLKVRLDTPAEVDYHNADGILPYVLDQILAYTSAGSASSTAPTSARKLSPALSPG